MRNQQHRSGWDSPITGNDLLAAMLRADERKRSPLP